MNLVLWALQTILAVMFIIAGLTKVSQPKEKLRTAMSWVDDFSPTTVKVIGGLEILGAVGLILPWASGIAPVLTPIAALGLVALMLGAAATHLRRKEAQPIVINLGLAIAALLIFVGRI